MANSKKKKSNISNLDLFIIAHELNNVLSEGFIDNIYEINDNLLQIKCRTKQGKMMLILDASKRINFTHYDYPTPPYPSQYCSALRKYMKGRRILRVYQHELDRILIIELANRDGVPWKFIIELFLGGNFLLIDDKNLIFMAKHYKILKDRKILAKQEYIFPEKKGENFMEISKEQLSQIFKESDTDIVRTISRNISLVGYLAEEVCLRAEIDKNKSGKDLSDAEINKLYKIIYEIAKMIENNQYSGRIYTDGQENYVSFEPFELKKYDTLSFKSYDSYNEAIDDYFAKLDSTLLLSGEITQADKALKKYKRIHESQVEQIEESKEKREEHLDMGNSIYEHFNEVDKLLSTIMNARKNGMKWNEIVSRLKKGKEQGIPEALIFDNIYPKEAKISIILDGNKLKVDFRKSAVENANEIYKLAKKDKRRIEGAKDALQKTKKILKEKEYEKNLTEQRQVTLIKKPKKNWYEKFRWFFTSDGFLVVGGKDTSSNEVIGKKYLEKNDLFFHTELRGAPAVVLKNPEKLEIPGLTMKEASTFAASYSNAWREGWGSTEIFYVNSDQVTKSPNPGEFLTKGAFFIKGKKNLVPKPFLELAIGLILEPVGETEDASENEQSSKEVEEEFKNDTERGSDQNIKEEDKKIYYPRIIAGPLSAIKSKTDNFVRIVPQKSSLSGGKLADKIKTILIQKTEKDLKKWAELISNNDIMHFLPPGGSEISKKK